MVACFEWEDNNVKESDLKIRNAGDWELTITCYDTLEDFNALKISASNRDFRNHGYPVDKVYIHDIDGMPDEENIRRLFDFLRAYIHLGESLELWSVWLSNSTDKTVEYANIRLKDLTIEDLYKWSLEDDYCLQLQISSNSGSLNQTR